MSRMKDHLIPRRMQFTTSKYFFSFHSCKGVDIPNQIDIEKGLGTMELAEFVTSYDQKANFVKIEMIYFSSNTRQI